MCLIVGTLVTPTVVLVQLMPTSRLIPLSRKSFTHHSLFQKILCVGFLAFISPSLVKQVFCSPGSVPFVVLTESDENDDVLPFSRRVFILGPSHHVHLTCCALSSAEIYRTPLYDMRIDQKGIPHFHARRYNLPINIRIVRRCSLSCRR